MHAEGCKNIGRKDGRIKGQKDQRTRGHRTKGRKDQTFTKGQKGQEDKSKKG